MSDERSSASPGPGDVPEAGFGGDLGYEAVNAAIRRLAARLTDRFGNRRLGDRVAAYALATPDLAVLTARALVDNRLTRLQRGEILASLLYIVSPVDLVPEALFGPLGLVDDALVLSRLLDLVLNRLPPEVVRDLWPGDRLVLETMQGLAADMRRLFGAGLGPGLRALARRGLHEAGRRLRDAGFSPPALLGGLGTRVTVADA